MSDWPSGPALLARSHASTYGHPLGARFLTRDPLEQVTRDPYGYAGGNPVNRVDPTGLAFWDDWCVQNPFGEDDSCNSIAEQHPEASQGAADLSAGVLDTVSGGNADLILENVPGDPSTRVRWGSDLFQTGRVVGHGVMAVNLPAYLASTTVGAGVNAVDTTYVCLSGRGGRACGADAGGAWFGVLAPWGAGRAGAWFAPYVGTAAGAFADVVSTAVANMIDSFRRAC